MKEIILMMGTEYSTLKEVLKFHECGWSYDRISLPNSSDSLLPPPPPNSTSAHMQAVILSL
jgi:hypothetical protein